MAFNSAYDGKQLDEVSLPYNKSERDLAPDPRLISGTNMYVTPGGTLAKRPGTTTYLTDLDTDTFRVFRCWHVTNSAAIPTTYIVISAQNVGTNRFELFYRIIDSTSVTPFASLGTYRDIHLSQYPHEAVVVQAKMYAKAFPDPAAGATDLFGTVVIDFDELPTPAVMPWGIEGPVDPVEMDFYIAHISTNPAVNPGLAAGATTLYTDVDLDVLIPVAPPYVLQVDYEQILINNPSTAVGPVFQTTGVTRGYNDTVDTDHRNLAPLIFRDWASSPYIVTVNQTWRYTYAYKSITGHISNRAPEQSAQDELPSRTGPFFDQIPDMRVFGHADTTNIPTIVIYRSTDGGGTFYQVEEIANTGAGPIVYQDDSGPDGNPLPDALLDTADPAPSLTSNSPPPTVIAPDITGVDVPVQSTPLAYFQGRIWYAIGNYLFFSTNEELISGVPEEAFPSGIRGNFFKYQSNINNLQATSESLYIGTSRDLHEITGTNLETFASRPIFKQYGMMPAQPRAITSWGDVVAFLSSDWRVVLVDREGIRTISIPLDNDLTIYNDAYEVAFGIFWDMHYWSDNDKEWLVLSANVYGNHALSKHWVYDISRSKSENRDFWFVPWFRRCQLVYSGPISSIDSRRRLVFWDYNFTGGTAKLMGSYLDVAEYSDDTSLATNVTYTVGCRTYLFQNPTGNHVNTLRMPGLTSVATKLMLERTNNGISSDPSVTCYFDALSTGNSLSLDSRVWVPPRRVQSAGYKTLEYHIYRACQRASFQIDGPTDAQQFEIQSLALIWLPESGA